MSTNTPLKVGDSIQLNLQLWDGDETKYVRAYLTDDSGAAIGSPVDLTHVGEGLYLDSSVAMPSVEYVQATYVVFQDSGYLNESLVHSRSLDIYSKDELVPSQLPSEDDLEAFIVGDQKLTGTIDCEL